MSRVYWHRNKWYIDVAINNQRIRKSLNTSNKSTANKLAKSVEHEIISNVLIGRKPIRVSNTPLKQLIRAFLEHNHDWSISTQEIYKDRLKSYINNIDTNNASTKALTIRCVNKMYKWAYDNHLIPEPKRLDGGSKWEYRMRTFNAEELDKILNHIYPKEFQCCVRFAYYTGARRGEIAHLTEENIKDEYVVGKTGKRKIKLNCQAREVLAQSDRLWSYRPPYISQTFKKHLRRLNIKGGRFHDLRRTFGLNLIKQGMSIYQVSKLLGHSSVRTTEKHYAPLMVTDIPDFKL